MIDDNIDDKIHNDIDDKIYWMWKLLWSMIRLMRILMMRFIVCGNYYDWW
jgi:hypothetical protein